MIVLFRPDLCIIQEFRFARRMNLGQLKELCALHQVCHAPVRPILQHAIYLKTAIVNTEDATFDVSQSKKPSVVQTEHSLLSIWREDYRIYENFVHRLAFTTFQASNTGQPNLVAMCPMLYLNELKKKKLFCLISARQSHSHASHSRLSMATRTSACKLTNHRLMFRSTLLHTGLRTLSGYGVETWKPTKQKK